MSVTIKDIRAARERLQGVIVPTPVIPSRFFTRETGHEVYIKPENLQITGAFKIRGAYNKISLLSEQEKKKGLIASSAGNHAQGVAFAALQNKVNATIVMPKTTPLIKVEATRKHGARVILAGDFYDEAYARALEIQKEEDLVFIHPFNDPDIIAGQGTIGLEILEECPAVGTILVPVGGGGLISGVAIAAKSLNPDIRIIGVEPEGAPTLKRALEAGKVVDLDGVSTIADGVAVKRAGDLTFSLIREWVDEIVTIPDSELMESFLMLIERHKLVAENAAVLSLAALRHIGETKGPVVSLVSGGNIDVVTIATMIDQGLVIRGRLFCFNVDLPDKPGELLKVAGILADENANIIKLDHNQFTAIDRLKHVRLEVTIETNGHQHIKKIWDALKNAGFIIEKVY